MLRNRGRWKGNCAWRRSRTFDGRIYRSTHPHRKGIRPRPYPLVPVCEGGVGRAALSSAFDRHSRLTPRGRKGARNRSFETRFRCGPARSPEIRDEPEYAVSLEADDGEISAVESK